MDSISSDCSLDPVYQFEDLSKRVRKNARPKAKTYEKPTSMSPREEIYKSMIREIRNGDVAQMNSLVHKASGILRLAHYNEVNKDRKVTVSWDIDGRRVLTYEDKLGAETSLLQRQINADQKSKKSLLSSLTEPIFGLDTYNLRTLSEYMLGKPTESNNNTSRNFIDGEVPRKKVSKVWEDYIETGNASKLWQNKEGILLTESKASIPSSTKSARHTSACSVADAKSVINDENDRPPWKTCFRGSADVKLASSSRSSYTHSIASLPSMASRRKLAKKKTSKSQSFYALQENTAVNEKVDRIQHICVVNGSIVSFKDFGFENFSNWFGDEIILETNQQRSQPKIHHELDLANVKSKDIKIRLLDGRKLEINARRRIPGTTKSIRMKEVVLIPEGYKAEDLLMCRTKAGKLVIEEITHEPPGAVKKDLSKAKLSKSKARWKISRKIESIMA